LPNERIEPTCFAGSAVVSAAVNRSDVGAAVEPFAPYAAA